MRYHLIAFMWRTIDYVDEGARLLALAHAENGVCQRLALDTGHVLHVPALAQHLGRRRDQVDARPDLDP